MTKEFPCTRTSLKNPRFISSVLNKYKRYWLDIFKKERLCIKWGARGVFLSGNNGRLVSRSPVGFMGLCQPASTRAKEQNSTTGMCLYRDIFMLYRNIFMCIKPTENKEGNAFIDIEREKKISIFLYYFFEDSAINLIESSVRRRHI